MKSSNELYLVLGCFGYQEDDLVSCAAIENRILTIKPSLFEYQRMMDYFDICHLFDRSILDYNAVRHLLIYIRNEFQEPFKPFWSEKKWLAIEKFTTEHKKCGLDLKLIWAPPATSCLQERQLLISASGTSKSVPLLNKQEEISKLQKLRSLK